MPNVKMHIFQMNKSRFKITLSNDCFVVRRNLKSNRMLIYDNLSAIKRFYFELYKHFELAVVVLCIKNINLKKCKHIFFSFIFTMKK